MVHTRQTQLASFREMYIQKAQFYRSYSHVFRGKIGLQNFKGLIQHV